jgi:hypothetical protein
MQPGSFSAVHNETFMSDTYPSVSGPLGKNPQTLSAYLAIPNDSSVSNPTSALVVDMTIDGSQGPLVAGAILKSDDKAQVQLKLIDPDTLSTIASFNELPVQTITSKDFRPAGDYFYADNRKRTVIGTAEPSVWVVSHDKTAFTGYKKFPLAGIVPSNDELQAVHPDFSGRIWFTTKGGLVGTMNGRGQVLGTYRLPNAAGIPEGEKIDNGSASDKTGGVFIASNQAMYRFDAGHKGVPVVTWREAYDYGVRTKPGQIDLGTGTTPTLMGGKYVAITDNADPKMHVLVYRRGKTVNGNRLVCSEPVFQDHTSDTENSLVATESSIVVENNYGYSDPSVTTGGKTTTPGLARIDLDSRGCHTVWTNQTISIPSVVTKMSLKNGLIYSYSKPEDLSTTDAWYFTAVDFTTGNVVYKQLAGTGALYNNHYAPVYLGPKGTLYVGVLGGIVAMKDQGR